MVTLRTPYPAINHSVTANNCCATFGFTPESVSALFGPGCRNIKSGAIAAI